MTAIECAMCGAVGDGRGATLYCSECYEQARDEEQKRIEHIIQYRINAVPVPPDDNRPSVFRTIRVELQRVLADIRGAGEEIK